MSDENEHAPQVGAIEWFDLTVEDASSVRDFYQHVVGWDYSAAPMGDYEDYSMNLPGTGETVTGVCHARGPNSDMPAQWLIYVRVADADASANRCVERGGQVLDGPRDMGKSRFCVIQDPAGAVMALVSG